MEKNQMIKELIVKSNELNSELLALKKESEKPSRIISKLHPEYKDHYTTSEIAERTGNILNIRYINQAIIDRKIPFMQGRPRKLDYAGISEVNEYMYFNFGHKKLPEWFLAITFKGYVEDDKLTIG